MVAEALCAAAIPKSSPQGRSTLRVMAAIFTLVQRSFRNRTESARRLEWLGAAEDLAVEDRVPGVGVRRPATPSFGDLA
jgi:hypothetical protein